METLSQDMRFGGVVEGAGGIIFDEMDDVEVEIQDVENVVARYCNNDNKFPGFGNGFLLSFFDISLSTLGGFRKKFCDLLIIFRHILYFVDRAPPTARTLDTKQGRGGGLSMMVLALLLMMMVSSGAVVVATTVPNETMGNNNNHYAEILICIFPSSLTLNVLF
jgi:hypothetical protein